MKRFLVIVAMLVCAIGAHAQSGGYRSPLAGSSGGGTAQNAVTLSPNCSGQTNCYKTYSDGQYAQTATFSAGGTGGSTANLLTTNENDTGGQWLQVASPASNIGSEFTTSAAAPPYSSMLGAFKTNGTAALVGSCVGSGNQSGSSTTSTVNITATGGAGHFLVTFTSGGGLLTSVAFSDNSGSNTYANAMSLSQLVSGSYMMGYTTNATLASGTYTITATYGSAVTFHSVMACEFSGMNSGAGIFDSASATFMNLGGSTILVDAPVTTTTNDLLVQLVRISNTGQTYTVGKIGTQGIVTTQSSDPAFSSADVGKKVVLTTACDVNNGYQDCVAATPSPAAIAQVTGAHTAILSTIPILTNTSTGTNFTGWMIWGHDDGAQLAAAFQQAITLPSATLYLPCGFTLFGTASPFVISNTTYLTYTPSIQGCAGPYSSVLVPTLDFPFASASLGLIYSNTTVNMTGFGGFGSGYQSPWEYVHLNNFTVWGGGVDGTGETTALPMFNAALADFNNVRVVGWLWNSGAGANNSCVVNGASIKMENFIDWAAGSCGLKYTGNQSPTQFSGYITNSDLSAASATFSGILQTNNLGHGLIMQGGSLYIQGTGINGYQNSACSAAQQGLSQTGGFLQLNNSGFSGGSISGGSILEMFNSGDAILCNGITNTGGTVTASASQIDVYTQSGTSSFTDNGNNFTCSGRATFTCGTQTPWTTGATISAGQVYGSQSVTGPYSTALATGNFALTNATFTSTVGNDQRHFQLNISASASSAITIAYTFPQKFAVAPASCHAQQVGGTNPLLTFSTSVAATTTAVTFLSSASATNADTLQVAIDCQ